MADTVYAAPHDTSGSLPTQPPTSTSKEKALSADFAGGIVSDDYDVSYHEDGSDKFKKLSWPRLTVCLIVEAVALGALSLPKAYATLGMPAGVVLTVTIGLISIYTSKLLGQVCNKSWPIEVLHYSDVGYLLWGKWGRELVGVGFILFLILTTGSHALTGAIALDTISDGRACTLVWSIVSAVVLVRICPLSLLLYVCPQSRTGSDSIMIVVCSDEQFFLSLPTTFEKVAILGYVDFVSIVAAILITIIATGVRNHNQPGGLSAVHWSSTASEKPSFWQAFNAVTDIVFAFSFAVCQPSFQAEMAKPDDYMKSIWALGVTEIVIYTLTGSIIYAFVGQDVGSPALLSGGHVVSRVAFGVALPVIYISGAINTTTAARYIHVRMFKNSPHRYINTKLGIFVWVALCAGLMVISFIIAEAIPFFSELLSVISSLLISGFTFYLPAACWWVLLKEGRWNKDAKNIFLSFANGAIFLGGLTVLGAGMYSASMSIKVEYEKGTVGHPFECRWGVLET